MTLIQLTDTINHYRAILRAEKERFAEMYTGMTSCVGTLSESPACSCGANDRVAVTVTRLEPVKERIKLYEETLETYTDIFRKAASGMRNPMQGRLLIAIYLRGMSTGKAAESIKMSRRWAYKYRAEAEEELNRILKGMKP